MIPQDTKHSGIPPREALEQFRAVLRRNGHRGLVWLSGNSGMVRATLDTLLRDEPGVTLWYGDAAPDTATRVERRGVSRWLGAECDALVFDARDGFEPDAFGALSGALRGGGVLYLLTPDAAQWPGAMMAGPGGEPARRYTGRLAGLLADAADSLWIADGVLRRMPAIAATTGAPQAVPRTPSPGCLTTDQEAAVEAVMHVVSGHRRRPVVLSSDRGRGKSAAFGIAAARLVAEQGKTVLVTAARRSAVDTLMQHARAILPPERRASLRFVAPDALAQQPQDADLLLVDEAAAIPAPLLETLLKRYSRIAFATTVHGYEGTGRGFALRFGEALARLSNSWKTVRLETPIRWAPNDPLEALTFRLLMLDAAAAPDAAVRDADLHAARVECVDRDRLAGDEPLLRAVFGLLVQAHYKTRPSDLRQLLDAGNLSVHVLWLDDQVAATALVAREGGFDAAQAEAITAGLRRPQGHLLPETLAAHLGMQEAPRLHAARVMRIAVHPAAQGRGLGSRLLAQVQEDSLRAGVDYLGASFGATVPLLRFWSASGLRPVRLSEQRGASSGHHAVVVMQGLSERGKALFSATRRRFLRHFPHQLSDSLRDLDAPLVQALMRHAPGCEHPLTAEDLEDVRRVARERRFPESAPGALWPWLCNRLMSPASLDVLEPAGAALLVARILQKQDWTQCARQAGLTGHDQALACLREQLGKLAE